MKPAMRIPIHLICAAFILKGVVHADHLSDADREAVLANLEKLRDSAESKMDSKYRVALAAYRTAVASDEAAIELFLNCTDRVKFEEMQKKSQEFREWKRKESEKLQSPGLREALRQQLRWLILTIQAAAPKPDRVKLAAAAQEIVDSIFRDAQRLNGQEGLLAQPVTATVFAKAYDISNPKTDNWPLSPIQLDAIYSEILMPPCQKPTRVAELRALWIKRIQQEGAKVEFWVGNRREEKKGAIAANPESVEYQKFLEITQPKLQWDMEMDLFRNGDESGAAVRMLAHLEKHLTHPAAREWGEQFKDLLKPAAPPTPPKPAEEKAP